MKREQRGNRRPTEDDCYEVDDRYEDYVLTKRESEARRKEAMKDRERREQRRHKDR